MDLDDYRIPPPLGQSCDDEKMKRPGKIRKVNWFLKGPIPGEWLAKAARLPGKTFHVAIAVQHASAIQRTSTVKLSRKYLDQFGIGRGATSRGLHELERACLIEVERRAGSLPLVTLCKYQPSTITTGE